MQEFVILNLKAQRQAGEKTRAGEELKSSKEEKEEQANGKPPATAFTGNMKTTRLTEQSTSRRNGRRIDYAMTDRLMNGQLSE